MALELREKAEGAGNKNRNLNTIEQAFKLPLTRKTIIGAGGGQGGELNRLCLVTDVSFDE